MRDRLLHAPTILPLTSPFLLSTTSTSVPCETNTGPGSAVSGQDNPGTRRREYRSFFS
jgi:hypothetical protein